MATIFFDGAEFQNTADDPTSGWYDVDTGIDINTGTKHSGDAAFQYNTTTRNWMAQPTGSIATLWANTAGYFASLPSSGEYSFFVIEASNFGNIVTCELDYITSTTFQIKVYNGDVGYSRALVGTTSALNTSTWYTLQVGVYVNSSTGWIKFYVDGNEEVNATGLNTNLNGWGNVEWFNVGGHTSGTYNWLWDDTLLATTQNTGEIKIDNLVPNDIGQNNAYNTTGGSSDTGTDVGYVNDIPINTTNYIAHEGSNAQQSFEVEDSSSISSSDTIISARAWNYSMRAGGAAITYSILFVENSAEYTSQSDNATSASLYNTYYDTPPNTGGSWTKTKIDSIEVGQDYSGSKSTLGYLYDCGVNVCYSTPFTAPTSISAFGTVDQENWDQIAGVSSSNIDQVAGVSNTS